jgi:hypothetical protein
MRSYTFKWSIATRSKRGRITFTPSDVEEEILIATDWLKGEVLYPKDRYYDTGFLGQGSTKHAIYVHL